MRVRICISKVPSLTEGGHAGKIVATDRQIDRLMYELGVYPAEPRRMAGDGGRLTEGEIGLVEGPKQRSFTSLLYRREIIIY